MLTLDPAQEVAVGLDINANHVRGVRSGTVVNLTLNTLYEVMQWLPADPRAAGDQKDDWAWTLRSAANRPLLRWLEDGPLVVVSDRREPSARAVSVSRHR